MTTSFRDLVIILAAAIVATTLVYSAFPSGQPKPATPPTMRVMR